MKISELTYEQVGEDLGFPPICTGLRPDTGKPCGWSANWHYRGINSGGQLHWSRKGMRKTGLHAFVRAGLLHYLNWQHVYTASVNADKLILETYGIRIPASASKWERRDVLRGAAHTRTRLRSQAPDVYAWATYKGAK